MDLKIEVHHYLHETRRSREYHTLEHMLKELKGLLMDNADLLKQVVTDAAAQSAGDMAQLRDVLTAEMVQIKDKIDALGNLDPRLAAIAQQVTAAKDALHEGMTDTIEGIRNIIPDPPQPTT